MTCWSNTDLRTDWKYSLGWDSKVLILLQFKNIDTEYLSQDAINIFWRFNEIRYCIGKAMNAVNYASNANCTNLVDKNSQSTAYEIYTW